MIFRLSLNPAYQSNRRVMPALYPKSVKKARGGQKSAGWMASQGPPLAQASRHGVPAVFVAWQD